MSYSREEFRKMMAEQERKNAIIYEEVADDVIANLSDDDIERIRLNPVTSHYHFGLCLYIRNRYIHSGEVELVDDPDRMSSKIMKVIIRKLLSEYDNYPLVLSLIDHDSAFASVHRCAFRSLLLIPTLALLLAAIRRLKRLKQLRKLTRQIMIGITAWNCSTKRLTRLRKSKQTR